MKNQPLEVVRGSGNVFRDFARPNADVHQLKAVLAARIIQTLDREHLTVRAAHDRTRIAAADFSRIRQANLDHFTVDRLMTILNRLGSHVEVSVRVQPLKVIPATGPAAPAGLQTFTRPSRKRTAPRVKAAVKATRAPVHAHA
jgi:predicted XRE-type DNA-binding protein